MNRASLPAATLALAVLFAGCKPEDVEAPFEPSASYDVYRGALERLDLQDTALGREWIAAGEQALSQPVIVEPPFEEVVLLDPAHPSALAYVFQAERGRSVTITIETELDRYFADLFRVDTEVNLETNGATAANSGEAGASRPTWPSTLVASRHRESNEIRMEPKRHGVYILRIQPELLRGGAVRVRIVVTAPLAFPVQGAGPGSIWSFYGDPRDGGRRIHEGVDIFAERGTPVLAAADAVVTAVGIRGLGGKIITLRVEETGLVLYYAHLDEQLVRRGERVKRGDVIGKVGNTGNAITTPPHLHLGVYAGSWRFDVDPWNYLVDPPRVRPPIPANESLVGSWRSVARGTTIGNEVPAARAPRSWVNRNPFLRRGGAGATRAPGTTEASAGTAILDQLRKEQVYPLATGTPVQILGATGDLLRVRTPAGRQGYVAAGNLTERRDSRQVARAEQLHDPRSGDAFLELAAGTRIQVLGSVDGRTYIALPSGRVGFLRG